jgi:RNA polymerase sigma-70 factor (ECF subfamily)
MESSDLELAGRMSEGDTEALAICYDRYSSRVLGLLINLVGIREDAEDLLQVTFLEAWRRARQYDPARSRLDAWLYMIARSRALDHLRQRRDGRQKAPAESLESLMTECPSEGLERRESLRRLRDALRELPPDQGEALGFAFLAEMTHIEIAERLNIPVGTIKTRIRRGMARLREILAAR